MKSGALRALFPGLSVIYWYKSTIGASCRGLELKQQAKYLGEKINVQMTVASGRAIEGSQRWLKDGNNVSEPKEQEQQCFFTFLWYKLL